jgi:hypothetical protein
LDIAFFTAVTEPERAGRVAATAVGPEFEEDNWTEEAAGLPLLAAALGTILSAVSALDFCATGETSVAVEDAAELLTTSFFITTFFLLDVSTEAAIQIKAQ